MSFARFLAASAVCTLVFPAQVLLSQRGPMGPHPGSFEFGAGRMGPPGHVVTGQPYSGTRTSTFVETLANGTTITHTTSTQEARDSNGRSYSAVQSTGPNGSAHTFYTVFDPVNRVTTSWNSDSKQATLIHMPDPQGSGKWRPDSNQAGPKPGGQFRRGPTPEVTDLGAKVLNGVETSGTRSTTTFAAGSFGNNEPIVVTHEKWVSSDLGLTLSETDNDPRNGTRTSQFTSFQRDEPAASLFQVPQGYTVVERTPGRHS